MQRLARLTSERKQTVGIAEQHSAGRRKLQTATFAHEELDAEVLLELAHSRGDVGLHAMQPVGRARDAAGLDDSAEYVQI